MRLLIFVVLGHVFILSACQSVRCTQFKKSSSVALVSCTSTTNRSWPVNATATYTVTKDIDWYPPLDFESALFRNGHYFTMKDLSTCKFTSPEQRTLKTGQTFQVKVECTSVPWDFFGGDVLEFTLFQDPHHRRLTEFFQMIYVPIPGYTEQGQQNEIIQDENKENELRKHPQDQ